MGFGSGWFGLVRVGSVVRYDRRIGIYRELLGEAFESLHPHVRRAHEAPLDAEGIAGVRSANNWVGALIARAMTFPRPGQGVCVELRVRETADGTSWERRFGGDSVRTVQRLNDGHMVEHRGFGQLWFAVTIVEGEVHYETVRASLFGLVLPRSLTPRATGRVIATEDGWQTQIEVSAPLVGLLCAYSVKMQASP
jgi:hypothetical protein